MNNVTLPDTCVIHKFCNNMCCVLPLNWEPKEFAFPVNATGVPQVKAWSDIGQKERVQIASGSHRGDNNAASVAARDPNSPRSRGDELQDGLSLLRNCSDGPLDVLPDRRMLIRPCT